MPGGEEKRTTYHNQLNCTANRNRKFDVWRMKYEKMKYIYIACFNIDLEYSFVHLACVTRAGHGAG